MAKAPRTTTQAAAAPAAAEPSPPIGNSPDASTGAIPHETIAVSVSTSSPQGRRRAGFQFGREVNELNVDEATLALLEGDPQLVVKRV